ncbi:hypothetical protein EDEG_00378 [Edhazardia aedis USNM 41457]|uniref:Uncharacterized protein n=1 Tax=Edhazardia aedis (strain USNM 41457) TaxID=1003232 RepID=J9DK89_EDHAE|nr:hypothetical protein EDEG_00378 [Edhazardia aedis USNM 41457]|eukprot:EJW01787.1 hypothetical protein EDEG_00378 [Edhazardia aedis USNM 41457]
MMKIGISLVFCAFAMGLIPSDPIARTKSLVAQAELEAETLGGLQKAIADKEVASKILVRQELEDAKNAAIRQEEAERAVLAEKEAQNQLQKAEFAQEREIEAEAAQRVAKAASKIAEAKQVDAEILKKEVYI